MPDPGKTFSPQRFDLKRKSDQKKFEKLKRQGVQIIDTLTSQLTDLLKIKHPLTDLKPKALKQLTKIHTHHIPLHQYGNWFYYAWNNTLVHVLPEDEFIEVRTNRNKYKISHAEQMQLKQKKIGIVGMSLGSAIALALATERNFGEIRLADFDEIELANLNRLPFGVQCIGMSKALLTARKISEIDPYLRVKVFEQGIDRQTIMDFIDPQDKLDLIIEECDDVEIKFLTRLAAKKHCIPVLMETNGRPMLDIERFDLEPERPIFHGWIEDLNHWKWSEIQALSRREKMSYLLRFVRDEGLTDILRVSLSEMGKSLTGYCQPASTFTIGSGLSCEATRKILLGKHQQSGRYIMDVDGWIDGKPQAA